MSSQRGGFGLGMVVGLLIGLALALAVALYITKAPVPFVNKVPQRTAEQDNAESERNRNWDPNAPLAGKGGAKAASGPAAAASAAPAMPAPAGVAASAAAPGAKQQPAAARTAAPSTGAAPEAFVYFVQVGAFTRSEEAEQQRAKLALLGYTAKITEREQSGRTIYRVRLGPYETRDEADGVQVRLTDAALEARLVRVERQ
jgi:cell division protein FtsN